MKKDNQNKKREGEETIREGAHWAKQGGWDVNWNWNTGKNDLIVSIQEVQKLFSSNVEDKSLCYFSMVYAKKLTFLLLSQFQIISLGSKCRIQWLLEHFWSLFNSYWQLIGPNSLIYTNYMLDTLAFTWAQGSDVLVSELGQSRTPFRVRVNQFFHSLK